MKRFYLLIIIIILYSIPVFSAEKMRIAILDFKSEGVSTKTARTIVNMIRSDMVNIKKFIVVERSQMDAILEEQGLQMTGCTDQSCAVKVGRLMSANKILIGEIGSIGKAIVITVRIVDVEKGVSEFAQKETAPSEDELNIAVSKLTEKLSDSIEEAHAVKIPTGYYIRSLVPGWGQFYAGKTTKGIIYSGTFGLACAFAIWAHMDYSSKQSDYEDLPAGISQKEYDDKYNTAKSAGNIALASIGLVGAIYIANWIDILFFTKDVYYKKAELSYQRNWYTNITISSNPFYNNRENLILFKLGYRF